MTTATGIWLTAAVGVAVGLGRLWLPVLGALLAWAILAWLREYERRIGRPVFGVREESEPWRS